MRWFKVETGFGSVMFIPEHAVTHVTVQQRRRPFVSNGQPHCGGEFVELVDTADVVAAMDAGNERERLRRLEEGTGE
jgi:hypothetical protein